MEKRGTGGYSMARKHRKARKRLGHRRFGRGDVKHGRGSGCKGGKGMGGADGPRKFWTLKYLGKDYFGKHGFVNPTHREVPVANIGDLLATTSENEIVFEGKVLGGGSVNRPITLRAVAISESAKEKLQAAGGTFIPIIVEGKGSRKKILEKKDTPQ